MYDQQSSQRRLKPKRESADQGSSAALEKPSKKRVTASACVACRKRKSKCDSTKPACSACISVYHTPCSYDTESEPGRKGSSRRPSTKPDPIPPTISGLKDIISNLQAKPDSDVVLLNQLKNVQTRLEGLALGNDAPPTPVSSTSSSVASSSRGAPPTKHLTVPIYGQETAQPLMFDSGQPAGVWFEKPLPQKLISDLFNQYIYYHHPYFPIFSVEHFIKDFTAGESQFCSSMLVYAVLSMACGYWKGTSQGGNDMAARAQEFGETFSNIVQRRMCNTREFSLTTVQALAILGVRQGSVGDLNGAYHWHGAAMRMAIAMNMHLEQDPEEEEIDPLEMEVRQITFWGLYNLEMALDIFAGKVSQIANTSIGIPKPHYSEKRDSAILQPQKGRLCSETQAYRAVYHLRYVSHFCELSKLVNEINLSYYAPQKQIVAGDIHYALQRYRSWEHDLPVDFQSTDIGGAEISYLHMYYRQLIIQLLRPFLSYDAEKLGLSAKDICMGRAAEIMQIWRGLKAQYPFRELHMLVICPLRDTAHIFLTHSHEPSAAGYFSEIIEDLRNISYLHPMAGNVISSLYEFATKHRLAYPAGLFDRFFQDLNGNKIPPASMAALTIQAKIDVNSTPPPADYYHQGQAQYEQQEHVQETGHYHDMEALSQQQAAYFADSQGRQYSQYLGNQQMSGNSGQPEYQIMQPYSGHVHGSQQPSRS